LADSHPHLKPLTKRARKFEIQKPFLSNPKRRKPALKRYDMMDGDQVFITSYGFSMPNPYSLKPLLTRYNIINVEKKKGRLMHATCPKN